MDLIESRTISLGKFIRIVGNKLSDYPSFSLLLGAGCSVYSQIRPASDLISQWRNQLYREQNCINNGLEVSQEEINAFFNNISDYDTTHEYSYLFEKLYDTPSQRRVFVEKEIENKLPSIGYAYMVRLFEEGFFSTIFTTNFDDLANEAFYIYPQKHKRPIVCDEDSHISSITVTSNRTKIIKLHGDYLYDNIRATTKETSSLNKEIESKFKDFAHETGLIVIGYSCGDDSVMSAIQNILKDTAGFKNGIYWCLRKNEGVPSKLLEIIKKEDEEEKLPNIDQGSNFRKNFIVRIDGFDELMCELTTNLVNGFSLAGNMSNMMNEAVINDLHNNPFYDKSNSELLKKEIKRLKDEAQKYNRWIRVGKSRQITTYDENIDEEDPVSSALFKYQMMDAQGKYDEIVQEIDAESPCTNDNFQLLDIKMKALFMLQRFDEAIDVANKLIAYDHNVDYFYLNKANCYQNIDYQQNVIEDGLTTLPNSRKLNYKLATIYDQKNSMSLYMDSSLFNKAEECYLKSMGGSYSPYSDYVFDLYDLYEENDRREKALSLVNRMNEININAFSSIALQVKYWLKYNKEKRVEDIISYINEKNRCPEYKKQRIELLKAEVYSKKNAFVELKKFCLHKPNYLYQKSMGIIASIIYKRFRNINLAISCLENAIKKEWTNNNAMLLFDYYCDIGEIEKAKIIYEDKRINKSILNTRYWEATKDWQQIINDCKRRIEEGENDANVYILYTYALLQKKDYSSVVSIVNPLIQDGKEPNPILIINYELARYCLKNKVSNKERISRLGTNKEKNAQIGAAILLNNIDEAKKLLIESLEEDFSGYYSFKNMYIFQSGLVEKGFIDKVVDQLKTIDLFTKQEEEIVKSF